MKFLQILNEASTLQVSDLKKVITKDKKVSMILSKDVKLEDITDKEGFLSTLKFYIFNNENVRMFVKSRHDIKDVNKFEFDDLKKKRASDLTQSDLDIIGDFLRVLFKEHTSVSKNTLSPDAKRELRDWVNGDNRYHALSGWAIKELQSVPGLKPSKRILVYRGLLFSESSLKISKSYDGTLEVGQGQKFLKSIKDGSREVDLSWERPSSWTTSKEIAERFAQYGPASSQNGAMMQWLGRMSSKKAIDGALGYVISTFVNPEDVIIDFSKIALSGAKHGDEGEVIIKAGTIKARIVKKYTVEGEVDPDEKAADTSKVTETFDALTKFVSENGLPSDLAAIKSTMSKTRDIYGSNASALCSYPDLIVPLMKNSTTTTVIHLMDKYIDFFNSTFKNVTKDDLKIDKYMSTDEEFVKKLQALSTVYSTFTGTVTHSKFVGADNQKGKGQINKLSAEEFRATISSSDLAGMQNEYLKLGYFKDESREFISLGNSLKIEIPSSFKVMGAAKQKPYIDEVINAFFEKYSIESPGDSLEKFKSLINLLRKAYRNYSMIDTLSDTIGELMQFQI